ncbi:MAG: DUF6263 family protein [Sedimentisphaerales bacterium]
MSDKTFSFIATVVVCSLLLTIDCTYITEETVKSKAESEEKMSTGVASPGEETTKPEGKPKEQLPTVELALKFVPQDSTTYRVITEAEKAVSWEGPLPEKPSAFKGGHTGNRMEMTFTQRIQSIDNQSNAVAKITIKQLKYLAKVRDNVVLDFDSSREKERDNLLSKLIGKSYTIELSPAGRVLKIIDVNEIQAAIKGDSSAHKAASALLSPDTIKKRHAILALPVAEKNQLRKGDNWSDVAVFSFGMMGSKSYEKIYTLKEIKETDHRQIAIIEMNAIPSSEMVEQMHKEQATGLFSNLFDNIETYRGELKFDLTAGKIEKYIEKLRTEWIAVEPFAGQENDKEPAALRMAATRLHHLQKID